MTDTLDGLSRFFIFMEDRMEKYNLTEISLLQLIQNNPQITIDEMCIQMYLARSAVTKYLKKFNAEGLIYSNGEKKPKYARLLTIKARLLLTKK